MYTIRTDSEAVDEHNLVCVRFDLLGSLQYSVSEGRERKGLRGREGGRDY